MQDFLLTLYHSFVNITITILCTRESLFSPPFATLFFCPFHFIISLCINHEQKVDAHTTAASTSCLLYFKQARLDLYKARNICPSSEAARRESLVQLSPRAQAPL